LGPPQMPSAREAVRSYGRAASDWPATGRDEWGAARERPHSGGLSRRHGWLGVDVHNVGSGAGCVSSRLQHLVMRISLQGFQMQLVVPQVPVGGARAQHRAKRHAESAQLDQRPRRRADRNPRVDAGPALLARGLCQIRNRRAVGSPQLLR